MNRKELEAKLQVVVDKLAELEKTENPSAEEIKSLHDEFSLIKADIENLDKVQEIKDFANQEQDRKVAIVEVKENQTHEFKSAGEFYSSVHRASVGHVTDNRLVNTASEFAGGEDGSFLIPPAFSAELQKKITGDEALLPKTQALPISGNHMSMPVRETAPWDGTGVQAYWTEEGGTISDSKPKYRLASWRLHKLAALVPITDELLGDAVALEAFMKEEAGDAINYKVNDAILFGSGAGKPMGIDGSGFTVTVAKEGSQSADTVLFPNITKMWSRLLPKSRAKAVWYINPMVEDQVKNMAFDSGSDTLVPAYLPPGGISASPYGLLLGRPVIPMLGSMKELGDKGDILLADLSYYKSFYAAGGVQDAMSIHLYFDKATTAFRFIFRVDGQCVYNAPISPENGTFPMSAFINLAAR